MKETFLRAADIVEEMGLAMETLDDINGISTNSTLTSQSTLQRNRRSSQLNMTDYGVQETPLVKSLAEKMRTMPITNVRRIRSGVKSFFKYNSLENYKSIHSLALVIHYIRLSFLSNLVAEELNVGRPENEKCRVKNMSCVAFPTKKQCSGIGLGGCVSKSNYISL